MLRVPGIPAVELLSWWDTCEKHQVSKPGFGVPFRRASQKRTGGSSGIFLERGRNETKTDETKTGFRTCIACFVEVMFPMHPT